MHFFDKLEVFIRDDGERGVKTLCEFRDGQFVCEFEANLLTKKSASRQRKNIPRKASVYILEVCEHIQNSLVHVIMIHLTGTGSLF